MRLDSAAREYPAVAFHTSRPTNAGPSKPAPVRPLCARAAPLSTPFLLRQHPRSTHALFAKVASACPCTPLPWTGKSREASGSSRGWRLDHPSSHLQNNPGPCRRKGSPVEAPQEKCSDPISAWSHQCSGRNEQRLAKRRRRLRLR